MTGEEVEAYALGGIGAAKGVYEEYLEPNFDMAVLTGVVAVAMAVGATQFYLRKAVEMIQSK